MSQPGTRHTPVDVVIVGCGAGGAVAAKELAESGLSVIVLEAGRRFDPAVDYLTDRMDFEITAPRVLAGDPTRDRYTVGRHAPFDYMRVKGVGGSTLAYLGVVPRFHESDFRVRSEDGVAADWPLTYADLEPYYTRVEWQLGVAGPGPEEAGPFAPPRSRGYPTPAHELPPAGVTMQRAAEKLGLRLAPMPLAIPSLRWRGQPECVRAGTCDLGCRAGAKSSVDVTYVRAAEATGRVEIRPEAVAREITVDAEGRARSVVYLDRDGCEHEVHGRVVVVAGNAVETPRLLLLSRSARFPTGLANGSGLVGRYFMEHLAVAAWGVFAERVDAWRGVPAGGSIDDFYATDAANGFARGFTIEVNLSRQWPLSVARRVGGWGAAHKARMRDVFGHLIGLATVGEQLPDPRNRVTLDPAVTDRFGLAVPRLLNAPRENDLAMVTAMRPRLTELLETAGTREIWDVGYLPGWSAHYLGTCRMGRDPRTSVVDAWGRAHDVPNLYIADGSVFVTGAAVNPALTIMALATRTAAGILAAFESGEVGG